MSEKPARQLEWSPRAQADLWGSFEYIAEEDLNAAYLVRDRLVRAASMLQTQPTIGKPGKTPGTRELPVSRTGYTLIYRVRGQVVQIGRVFHQRRDR
jgi:toxin ParE1/3/4